MSKDNIDTHPYELKLFRMFKSCDKYQNGFLDEYGLSHLCRLLELQDSGLSLISSLASNFENSAGVTFDQFKEALLQFLGTEAENKCNSKEYLETDMAFQKDTISANELIKIWDQAHIPNAKSLLNCLGIEEEEIDLKQLYKILEDESKIPTNSSNVHLTRALIALQAAELFTLRQSVRQLKDENNKLQTDNKDANRRAALLAAEIDECHSSLEDKSKKELQLLEQRHSSALREINLKLANEQEKWNQQSTEMVQKINTLEKERLELFSDIRSLQKENSEFFGEVQKNQRQKLQLSEQNEALRRELEKFDNRADGFVTQLDDIDLMENFHNVSLDLLNHLFTENAALRDKNDELYVELDELKTAYDRIKRKRKKVSVNISECLPKNESQNGANSSVNKQNEGKSLNSELNAVLNYNDISESDDEINSDDSKNPEGKAHLMEMFKDLTEDRSAVDEVCRSQELRCKELETSLEQMKRAYEECEEYWEHKLAEERQLFEEEQSENDKKFRELMEKVHEYEEQFKKDGRLSPIEEKDGLEQQYEALEIEKVKILNELQAKEREVDCLKLENSDLRLRLGETVEILTGACELNNEIMNNTLTGSPAANPINYLWNQSTIQEPVLNYEFENELQAIQTNNVAQSSPNNLAQSFHGYATKPENDPNAEMEMVSPKNEHQDSDSLSIVSAKSSEIHSICTSPSSQPAHSASCKQSMQETMKEGLKRLKCFEMRLKKQINDLTLKRDGLIMELQQLHEAKPVIEKSFARTAHPSLLQRIDQLELRNRHMQNVIKRNQKYTESLLQQSWQQYQLELKDLQASMEQQKHILSDQSHRLQNADVVIKDLYVENAHLTTTIQSLEQQISRDNYLLQQPIQCINTMPGMA